MTHLRQLDDDGYVAAGVGILPPHRAAEQRRATLRRTNDYDQAVEMTVISPAHEYAYASETDIDIDADFALPPTPARAPSQRSPRERAESVAVKVTQLNRERASKQFWFGLCIGVVVLSLILSVVAIILALQKAGCDCPAESATSMSLGSSGVTTDIPQTFAAPTFTPLSDNADWRQVVSDVTATVSDIGAEVSALRVDVNALNAARPSGGGGGNNGGNGNGWEDDVAQLRNEFTDRVAVLESNVSSLWLEDMTTLRADVDAQMMTLSAELQSELNQTVLEVSAAIDRNTLSIDSLQNASEVTRSQSSHGLTFGDGIIPSSVELSGIGLADAALLLGLIPNNIQRINGNLRITRNSNLDNISGLTNVTSIGGFLQISNNDNLDDISGLTNVTSIGGNLQIDNNANLDDISGLTNVTSIGGALYIYNNAVLDDISGLTNVISIGGDVSINQNANLNSISGLSNLRRIEGTIYFRQNGNNINYQPLQTLECHGGFPQNNLGPSNCQNCPSWLINKPRC